MASKFKYYPFCDTESRGKVLEKLKEAGLHGFPSLARKEKFLVAVDSPEAIKWMDEKFKSIEVKEENEQLRIS